MGEQAHPLGRRTQCLHPRGKADAEYLSGFQIPSLGGDRVTQALRQRCHDTEEAHWPQSQPPFLDQRGPSCNGPPSMHQPQDPPKLQNSLTPNTLACLLLGGACPSHFWAGEISSSGMLFSPLILQQILNLLFPPCVPSPEYGFTTICFPLQCIHLSFSS